VKLYHIIDKHFTLSNNLFLLQVSSLL
jgi:hypothetical protein